MLLEQKCHLVKASGKGDGFLFIISTTKGIKSTKVFKMGKTSGWRCHDLSKGLS